MQPYQHEQARNERVARTTGIVLTVAAHLCLVVFGVFKGMKYLYPPPQEQTFVIDFQENEPERAQPIRTGTRPQAEEVDRTKPVELVQRSEAPHVGTKPNKAPESVVDDHGDVEISQPVREKPIDRRSLFPTADNKADKDTLAAQTAAKVSEALKAGHPQGNTKTGRTDGTPNARLKGRTVLGTLPKPAYGVQESGVVVVKIWVDQYGTVQKALAGADGSTTNNSTLLAAARKAAMDAHFNVSADAPALQEGTITYVFNLK